MIVSIFNQKGGTGKSTIAVNLACALQILDKEGTKSLLVDADPQGSARDWNAASTKPYVDFIALDRPTLDRDIQPHANRYFWTIIDGPSRLHDQNIAHKLNPLSYAILKCSRIMLIPIKPSSFDFWAILELVDLIKAQQSINTYPKAAFIISQQISNTLCARDIRIELAKCDLPIFDSFTCNRVAYMNSIAKGQSVIHSKDKVAAAEIEGIAKELMEFAK